MNCENGSPASAKSLRDKVQPTLETLRERYPHAFLPEGEPPRPLQVGILQELFVKANDISRRRLRWAVYYYANNIAYQQALANGKARYDLEGQPAGEITEEHREAAIDKLKELKPKQKPNAQKKFGQQRQKNYQSRGKSRFPQQGSRTSPASSASSQNPAVVVRQRQRKIVTTLPKTTSVSGVKSSGNRSVLSLKRRVTS